ncbi:MAG: hypothetical protein WAS07_04215 [Micropruina sp.]|nr:hypothetical protein [Micropruina sp.]
MDLSNFYALISATCFTLVGLWWTVVERHPEWKSEPRGRQLAGGTYLAFLLPGVMAMFAQINPDTPVLWRASFGTAAVVGIYVNVQQILAERSETSRGPFRRNRWAVAFVYLLVLVLGVAPELARGVGATPLQVASFLLVLLVILAHGLTWEFMMEPEDSRRA